MFSRDGEDVLSDVSNTIDLNMSVVDVLGLSYVYEASEPFWRASRMFLLHYNEADKATFDVHNYLFESCDVAVTLST